MRTESRFISLLLAFVLALSLMPAASAAAFTNSERYLRTSFSDDSFIEISIYGNEAIVSGRLTSDGMTGAMVYVGPTQRMFALNSVGEGDAFGFTFDLTKIDMPAEVTVLTRQSGRDMFYSVLNGSVVIDKSGEKYVVSESPALKNNRDMLSGWLNPGEYCEFTSTDAVKELSDAIAGGETDSYKKLFSLYKWVAQNIYFDMDAFSKGDDSSEAAEEVLDTRVAVSSGFSELLCQLIRAQGIPAFKTQAFALGLSFSSLSFTVKPELAYSEVPNHEFVEAYIDGRWVIMDATWDCANTCENGVKTTVKPTGYLYFDVTPEFFSTDHKIICRGDYTINLREGVAENSNNTKNGYEPSNWAKPEITKAFINGLVPAYLQKGYIDNITRQNFCHLIVTMLLSRYNAAGEAELLEHFGRTGMGETFTDTDDGTITTANALGIVLGVGEGLFNPDTNITRQEAATMLKRAADIMGVVPTGTAIEFTDIDLADSWALDGIGFVSSLVSSEGSPVMKGNDDGTFSPKSGYTVEQAILTVYRMFMCK